jgi:flagellar biosynthesis activator protein FlaF
MHSAAKAYGAVSQASLPPRELEAHVLMKSAAHLQAISDNWDARKDEFDPALLQNRKIWTILVSAVVEETNPLPRAIKQNIANLAIFIFKRTHELMQEPDPSRVGVLININREIAAGLRSRAQAA